MSANTTEVPIPADLELPEPIAAPTPPSTLLARLVRMKKERRCWP